MASSGSLFSETLQTITNTKLEELAKHQAVFKEQYSGLLKATQAEKDALKRLLILVDGAKTALGVKTAVQKNKDSNRLGRVISGGTSNNALETDLRNLDRFLEQAQYDPTVSPKVLEDWEKCVLQYLSIQSSKYEYADLYGKLATEWLSSEKSGNPDGDIEMSESFEEVPGVKKLESRSAWEKVVFEAADVDIAALSDYLEGLFVTEKGASKGFQQFRDGVEQFEQSLSGSKPFNKTTLNWVIKGVQASDLLSNEKREVLKDFLGNDIVLNEIGDVLNMRMSALSQWTWGDHVPLEQRRMLNGSYTIHMDEDLLQAMFLHYIGVKWSVFIKGALKKLRTASWKSNRSGIIRSEQKRREYYLGNIAVESHGSLAAVRGDLHKKRYFAHQLLDHETQRVEVDEGEEEADVAVMQQAPISQKRKCMTPPWFQQAPTAMMSPAGGTMNAMQGMQEAYAGDIDAIDYSDEDDGSQQTKNPMDAKQRILHMLSTEIILNTQLHGELTSFHAAFESWNPLLPHESILVVLSFFGISDKWIKFFSSFLKAPLKFMDDSSAVPRIRRRGTPGSHAISDVFGELILFCLDFSVNQSTNGGLLYRLSEDFWFWSHDYNTCDKAWSSVQKFTTAMGVELNDGKSGSVRIAKDLDPKKDDSLPSGDITWGFLRLDPLTGHFEIDQAKVDHQVEELRKQLQGKSKSVIGWIQAWNSFATTFFSANFGKPANCFGRKHVNTMLATHRKIQESIFGGQNVVHFLKQTIQDRFGVDSVPEGFLFFPVELGGLDLKSPFVSLLQICENVPDNPYDLMNEFEEAEREAYEEAKRKFEQGVVQYSYDWDRTFRPTENPDMFFSFDEFARYREEFRVPFTQSKAELGLVYHRLLDKPTEKGIDLSVKVTQAVGQLDGQMRDFATSNMLNDQYWKWVTQMYGPEMIDKFGGLNVVDPGLLPIGMVSIFREKRVQWQG